MLRIWNVVTAWSELFWFCYAHAHRTKINGSAKRWRYTFKCGIDIWSWYFVYLSTKCVLFIVHSQVGAIKQFIYRILYVAKFFLFVIKIHTRYEIIYKRTKSIFDMKSVGSPMNWMICTRTQFGKLVRCTPQPFAMEMQQNMFDTEQRKRKKKPAWN